MIAEEKEAILLDKKSFWKGFITAGCCILMGNVFVKEMILMMPWYLMPFEVAMPLEQKVDYVKEYLTRYHIYDVEEDFMEEAMFYGMALSMEDPYTYYLSANDLNQYMQSTQGEFVGIGVELFQSDKGEAIIYNVIDGNVAKEAGILAGDVIKSIDGKPIEEIEFSDVSSHIKGTEGEEVTLTVYRAEDNQIHEFVMVREVVVTQTVSYDMIDEDKGYLKLTGFKENTYAQFSEALLNLVSQDMKGLVIDLRDNPGGLVSSVQAISEELLPEGILVSTEDKNGNTDSIVLDDIYYDIPMVVLVNENSASASEIFAGAAQDKKAAKIVGMQTYGKGLVQGLFSLPDGSALNITIKQYFTPNGDSIHGVGVTPDYIIPMGEGYLSGSIIDWEDDPQFQKAVEILGKEMKEE